MSDRAFGLLASQICHFLFSLCPFSSRIRTWKWNTLATRHQSTALMQFYLFSPRFHTSLHSHSIFYYYFSFSFSTLNIITKHTISTEKKKKLCTEKNRAESNRHQRKKGRLHNPDLGTCGGCFRFTIIHISWQTLQSAFAYRYLLPSYTHHSAKTKLIT